MVEYLVRLEEAEKLGIEKVGGKSFNLSRVRNAGIRTPDGYCLTTDAFEYFGQHKELPDIDFSQVGYQRSAVRSSATIEDGRKASFAGMFDSFLDVPLNGIAEAVLKVYDSARQENVGSYMRGLGISKPVSMSVLINEMLNPDLSGIAFTVRPLNQNEAFTECVFGLSDKLTLGSRPPDAKFYWDKKSKSLLRKTTKHPFPYSDEKINELFSILMSLEKLFDYPQDIEWAIAHDDIYILQSRPITGLNLNG